MNRVFRTPEWRGFFRKLGEPFLPLASDLIKEVDINKVLKVSSLWSYCGLTVESSDKGFNKYLNRSLFINYSVILSVPKYNRMKSYYYNRLKSRHINNRQKIFKMCRRYVLKMFLYDYYIACRRAYNLPIRKLYLEEYLGHKHSSSNT